jgi:hypothetical protein
LSVIALFSGLFTMLISTVSGILNLVVSYL